ncbi:hypothetical protein NPIL_478531 [Nephila pilipes]|uniref:Uncharacterized protein n=1 Tax=Nephila pilipes TaxID=299642 RepID=A0A8X6NAZ8_NEPPI|nr:hypothetical protein NPIL_478531 [Nephila pilipes]
MRIRAEIRYYIIELLWEFKIFGCTIVKRRERELTLDKCVDACRESEYASIKGKDIHSGVISKTKSSTVSQDKVCSSFGAKNHFANICSKKMLKPCKVIELNDKDADIWIDNVKLKTGDDIKCVILIHKRKARFQIETGVYVNILPKLFPSDVITTIALNKH